MILIVCMKKVNKVAECNLLHGKLNPSKRTKYINIHYSLILRVCMNTRTIKAIFKNF